MGLPWDCLGTHLEWCSEAKEAFLVASKCHVCKDSGTSGPRWGHLVAHPEWCSQTSGAFSSASKCHVGFGTLGSLGVTVGPIWSGASKPEGPPVLLHAVMGRRILGPCGTALGPIRSAAAKLFGTCWGPLGPVGARWDPLGPFGTLWDPLGPMVNGALCGRTQKQFCMFGTAGTDDLYNTKFKVPSPISPTGQDHRPGWSRLPEVDRLRILINFSAKALFFPSPRYEGTRVVTWRGGGRW